MNGKERKGRGIIEKEENKQVGRQVGRKTALSERERSCEELRKGSVFKNPIYVYRFRKGLGEEGEERREVGRRPGLRNVIITAKLPRMRHHTKGRGTTTKIRELGSTLA